MRHHKPSKRLTRLIFLAFLSCTSSLIFAQKEGLGPIMSTSGAIALKTPEKSLSNTFDSSFIYYTDTLILPFFDEFSKAHFQSFLTDFNAPGVTSTKQYRILDINTSNPISNGVYFTAQQTFRRIYDLTSSTYTDENFPSVQYKVSDLSHYPAVYISTDLFPPYYIYDTVGVINDVSDTVWIVDPEYYQDSATQFFAVINDPNAFWLDRNVNHNFHYAFEPRTLGVVTFDGLDSFGYPYQMGSASTNYADYLTSKPINLSGVNGGDSLYFSFLYQPQGYGDAPESSDSLVLEFYAKDYDQWKRVWSAAGEPLTPFKIGHLRIIDTLYFKNGFQFRFKNYGALSGSLDHFHLDYVHLRTMSGYQDTLFKDFAFVYPPGSLLKTYTSVPWDHFKNNSTGKMNDAFQVVVHNGSNLSENNQNGQVEVYYDGNSEGSFTLNAQTLAGGINYAPLTTSYSEHDLTGGYVFDITKPGSEQRFDIVTAASAQFPNYATNDSASGIQYFGNFYSYDDGSAEAAYGPTGTQARLAMRFDSYEADSLIGLKLYFVPSVNDVSNKLFLITVWSDDNGKPGSVLYEDDAFFPRSPEYGHAQNEFINYYFKDTLKVPVGTAFYVGWRQIDPDRLNIGFDRNIDQSAKLFYSVDNGITWIPSQIEGTAMIRPIFSTEMDDILSVSENPKDDFILLYPNPTSESVSIKNISENFEGVRIYNIQGKQILESKESFISLKDQPSGVYFFQIFGRNEIYKIIKN